MKKGIFIVILYGLILYIAFLFREPLLAWVERSDFTQLPIMFFLAVLFGTIPIIPFTVFDIFLFHLSFFNNYKYNDNKVF